MKMKKSLCILLALVLVFSLLPVSVFAASATFSLSGSGSVTVGSQVKVTVKLSGSEKIGSWRFSVSYDPAYLEYVSGADSGGGGAVSFADSSDGVASLSKTIVFRAKKIGSATVSVGSAQVVSFDSVANMSVNTPSKKINIVAAPTLSGENRLSALSVSTGELTPAFDQSTTAYTVSVPFETTSMAVSATAKDGKAGVSITPSDALAVGENKIDVVVTAENGSTRTYTVTVTRQESELAGVTALLGDVTYNVAYDPATLQIPEGYTPTTALLGEKKILAYASPQNTILISFLSNETAAGWYIFKEDAQSFSEFLPLTGAANTIVILEPSERTEIPEGFLPYSLVIGFKTYSAYKAENSEEKNVYLVYGMTGDGATGFYYYDAAFGTFTSFFVPRDSKGEEEAAKQTAALQSLLKESEDKADQMEIISLAVGIVAALLFIGLIISLATRKRKAKPHFTETVEVKKDVPVKETSEEKTEEKAEEKTEEPTVETPEDKPTEPFVTAPAVKKGKRKAKRTLEEVSHKPPSSAIVMDDIPPILRDDSSHHHQ